MKVADHESLFKRYQSGEATLEEQAIVEDYILNNEFTPLYLTEGELEAVKVKLGRRIGEIPFAEKNEEVVAGVELRGSKLKRKLPLWMASAAAVAAVVFGVWFFNYRSAVILNSVQDPALAMNDIAPGKNTATLTLANGKTIVLSDAKTGVVVRQDKLAYNDGAEILKQVQDDVTLNGKAQMLTATTPRGGTYQVTLPDGTKVWLNADSKISFPARFSRKGRKVLIEGEAYFEVAKNKKMPFIVESGGQRVEVLGTHFNVSAYQGEAIRTTLLEGSVRVSSELRHAGLDPVSRNSKSNMQGVYGKAGVLKQVQDDERVKQESKAGVMKPEVGVMKQEAVVLKPGQQALLTGLQDGEGTIKVQTANIEETISWKNGDFNFNGEEIRSIMQKLARWYDIEVSYEGKVSEELYYARISRNRNISEVLKKLEQAQGVHFKIEGRRVTVTP